MLHRIYEMPNELTRKDESSIFLL